MKPKIAIACQGGGSQTAFTAGVLQALFEGGIREEFDIVSLSGTSGGAVCAALVWYAIKSGEQPVCKRLMAFWKNNTPHTSDEIFFNDWLVHWLRLVNSGNWPSLHLSPASPIVQTMMGYFGTGKRRAFLDFAHLLETHINFGKIASWGPLPDKPILVVGACNVLTGKLRKFISGKEVIRLEHIMASCAVPTSFLRSGLLRMPTSTGRRIDPAELCRVGEHCRGNLVDQDQPDPDAFHSGAAGRHF
jgi:NTE family protein